MDDELRKKAKQKVEAKVALYTIGIIFSFATTILLILSVFIPSAAFWFWLSILALVFTFGFIYLVTLGIPFYMFSKEWKEEEVELELRKLSRRRKLVLPPTEDLTEEDRLELEELERLKNKWEKDDQGDGLVV